MLLALQPFPFQSKGFPFQRKPFTGQSQLILFSFGGFHLHTPILPKHATPCHCAPRTGSSRPSCPSRLRWLRCALASRPVCPVRRVRRVCPVFGSRCAGSAALILRTFVRPPRGRNMRYLLPRDSLALIPRLSMLVALAALRWLCRREKVLILHLGRNVVETSEGGSAPPCGLKFLKPSRDLAFSSSFLPPCGSKIRDKPGVRRIGRACGFPLDSGA